MTEAEVQRLREAGISDATILEMQKEREGKSDTGVSTPAPGALPEVDPTSSSQVYENARNQGVDTQGRGIGFKEEALELAALTPDIVKYVGLPAAGAYGLRKLGEGILNRGAPGPIGPQGPVGPMGAPGPQGAPGTPFAQTPQATFETLRTPESTLNQARGPVSPSGTAPSTAQPQPGIVQQGMDYARRMQQIAAEKVQSMAQSGAQALRTAAPVARAATGIGAMVMPGNVGQNYPFPTSGPMRGREINPATGAPWTPKELEAYRAQYGG